MPAFGEALDRFKKDGFFALDTELYTEQLERLRLCARFLRADKPEIYPYQFHLNHVQFIRGYLPKPEQIIVGAVVEHHTQRDWSPEIADLTLLQMAKPANELNMGLRFNARDGLETPAEEPFEFALSDLLSQIDTWSSIKIDWVFFSDKNRVPHYLDGYFHNFLCNELADHAGTSLKEFSLKPFFLSKSLTALVNFLTQSTSLETLHLEIGDANRDDWLMLARALAVHPNLKYLDFGTTQLDIAAYSALSDLLDENYRISAITIAEPMGDWTLRVAYDQLSQRLSKPGRARFKEERLSLEALLGLAFQPLAEQEKLQLEQAACRADDGDEKESTLLRKRVSFLLSDQGTLAITDTEKVAWLKGAYVLPAVYQHHKEYMKEFSSLLQLRLDELVLEGANTVGYLLLEKAFEVKDTQIIKYLLESKADLFESPTEALEKPLLVRLFETEGPWQALVIHHLKQDLNVLVPAVKILSPYSKLEPICHELKEHLNAYFNILENRKKQPKLLRLLSGVISNFQNRQEECAQSFHNLVWYIKVATDDTAGKKVSYDSLFEAQEILEQILEDSRQAKLANRGFWGRSKLHDDLLRLGKELNQQLRLHQRALYRREKNKNIDYFADDREKDNAEFEKMRAVFTQEQERHAQEIAEMEVKRAQELAKMEAKIEALERLMQSQNLSQNQTSKETASSQVQEKPEGSAHFFRP